MHVYTHTNMYTTICQSSTYLLTWKTKCSPWYLYLQFQFNTPEFIPVSPVPYLHALSLTVRRLAPIILNIVTNLLNAFICNNLPNIQVVSSAPALLEAQTTLTKFLLFWLQPCWALYLHQRSATFPTRGRRKQPIKFLSQWYYQRNNNPG